VTSVTAPHAAAGGWLAANQQALMAEIAAVRNALAGASDGVEGPRPAQVAWPGGSSALDAVRSCFGLSTFERRIIVLCAAPELDGRFDEVLAAAQGDSARGYPTFGLALAAFPDAHWSALTPGSPLRHWRLIESGPGLLTSAPLHIDEWLLHVLAGAGGLDQRLAPVVSPMAAAAPMTRSSESAVADLTAAWLHPGQNVPVILRGPSRQQKRTVFAAACTRLRCEPWVLDAADLPAGAADLDELARLWERGASYERAALLIEGHSREAGGAVTRDPVERFSARLATPVAVAMEAAGAAVLKAITIEVAKPTPAEQRGLWVQALGQEGSFISSADGVLDRVTAHFDLDATAIGMAAERALRDEGTTQDDAERVLWDACRRTTRAGLDHLAQRLQSTATFDDLVLPEAQIQLLGDIVSQVKQRSRVYDDWQMAGASPRGLGISAVFAGPSGTGKTLAAEVVANSLALDLYRVDLSQVVSKYIGETEKNLRQIFEAAGDSGAVLLFDEADALFGKRSEVRDSHDRYANVEISYLLQAIDSYRGLALLTTNMRKALDTAFLRRLRFVITFPFPGSAERAAIWRRAFPPATPTKDLDVSKLAQLTVAGGTIRSIALHAAFTAADAGVPVGMHEVLRAAIAEYAKLERPLTDTETAGWV
jgi:hypothetical protein